MAVWGPTAIASDADDGHYRALNTTWYDRADEGYPAGEYLDVKRDTGDNYYGALRFQNVTIPNGATINSATLTLNFSNQVSIDAANSVMTVYGDVGTSRTAALSGTHHPKTGWTNSTASVAVTGLGDANKAINVATIVQEVVSLGGWASGDAICFALDPESGSDTYWSVRVVDYDADTLASRVTLEIDYTAGASGVAPRAVRHLAAMRRH